MNAPASILDQGRAPADWVQILAAKGIPVSERTLRERANRLGACIKLGRAMIITPEQMEAILKDGQQCPSNHTSAARPGGPKAASNTPASPSQTTTDAALAYLRSRRQRSGVATKKNGGSVVSFSATKKPRGR
jgi:hypothetical protein